MQKPVQDVHMTYDAQNIYILVECYHAIDRNIMIESLKRDWAFVKNDNFLFSWIRTMTIPMDLPFKS